MTEFTIKSKIPFNQINVDLIQRIIVWLDSYVRQPATETWPPNIINIDNGGLYINIDNPGSYSFSMHGVQIQQYGKEYITVTIEDYSGFDKVLRYIISKHQREVECIFGAAADGIYNYYQIKGQAYRVTGITETLTLDEALTKYPSAEGLYDVIFEEPVLPIRYDL